MENNNTIIERLRQSRFAKDSFWSVFGNGLGNALLLLAGIIIARLLGKDLYGEYGMVKTTMFYLAAFSTFGLGYTSTKFIAESISKQDNNSTAIARSSMGITLVSSVALCLLLCIFSHPLANFINTPQLAQAFQFLGIIMVLKAINTTQTGLLAGYKSFKEIGVISIISGLTLLLTCVPLTYLWSVKGSLLALILSQVALCIGNLIAIKKAQLSRDVVKTSYVKRLLKFSLPVAIQEFTYMVCNWGSMLLITRYASVGEVGIYTAATQWGSVILMIPSLLQNVFLSYLSSLSSEQNQHNRMLTRMILINLVCTAIPFIIILLLSGFICSFYGPTFSGLRIVLIVYSFSTIFMCLNNVLQADLLAQGHNWLLLALRTSRDIIIIVSLFIVLRLTGTQQTALYLSVIYVMAFAIFLVVMYYFSRYYNKKAFKE